MTAPPRSFTAAAINDDDEEELAWHAVPPDACASYTAMLSGLAELENDIHLHVHKENNVLFPRVLASA